MTDDNEIIRGLPLLPWAAFKVQGGFQINGTVGPVGTLICEVKAGPMLGNIDGAEAIAEGMCRAVNAYEGQKSQISALREALRDAAAQLAYCESRVKTEFAKANIPRALARARAVLGEK